MTNVNKDKWQSIDSLHHHIKNRWVEQAEYLHDKGIKIEIEVYKLAEILYNKSLCIEKDSNQ